MFRLFTSVKRKKRIKLVETRTLTMSSLLTALVVCGALWAGCEGSSSSLADGGDGSTHTERDGGFLRDGCTLDDCALNDADGLDAHLPDAAPPDPYCEKNGCLRSFNKVGDYTQEFLQGAVESGVTVENGYTVYTLAYFTDGREALATVTIPYQEGPPSAGYAIVANAHGTTGVGDSCALTGTVTGAGLAGTFGARGFIGVALDYPGLGTEGVHPYLVSESEGRAVLDSLRVATQLARLQSVPLSNRYATAGLSQGGHASLAAAAQHETYAPDLDIRLFAASGPATVWAELWRQGAAMDGPHLVYHALTFWAWSKHYDYDGDPIFSSTLTPDIDETMQTYCLYTSEGEDTLSPMLPTALSDIFTSSFSAAYLSGSWDNYQLFGVAFELNRIAPFNSTAPLLIYQGALDEVTPESHTTQVVEVLVNDGVTVDYQIVPDGGHTDVAFGPLAVPQIMTQESITTIRQHLSIR